MFENDRSIGHASGTWGRGEGLPERVFLSTRDEAKRAAVWERLRAHKTLAHRGQAATILERALRSSLVNEGRAMRALCATRAQASSQVLRRVRDLQLYLQGQPKGPPRNMRKDVACCLGPARATAASGTSPQERRAHELAYVPHIAGVFGVRCREGNSSPIARCGPVSENMDCRERMSATVCGLWRVRCRVVPYAGDVFWSRFTSVLG